MNVWLDDVRRAPKGWRRTTTVDETIALIRSGRAVELSLDYDLDYTDGKRKGVEVLHWLLNEVEQGRIRDYPVLHIHTANPRGGYVMAEMVRAIEATSYRYLK